MLPPEIIKKIRKIEIKSRKLASDVFVGRYKSVFKGKGMEFLEVREYYPGDDIRSIDWNVTARMGTPYVKKFVDERELTLFILLDLSDSNTFGTRNKIKREIAAEISGVLAFASLRNNDKIGAITFTDRVESYIAPAKGLTHVLRVIRDLLYSTPVGRGTEMPVAFDYLNNTTVKRSILFLVSDFLTKGFESQLKILNKRHDVIAIRIFDPLEIKLPNIGIVEFEDTETDELISVDTSSIGLRNNFNDLRKNKIEETTRFFLSNNIDYIDIKTDESYVEPLMKFFRQRAQKIR